MNDYGIQGREWWAQQWVDLLETSRFKKRLERARNYARQGNVLSIEFKDALVLALVQGTDTKPYQVYIELECFSDEEWENIIENLSQKAIFSAKLLAGEMPPNIQEVFSENGRNLYPFTLSEIRSRCSCPDKEIPCKHIGAVYYLLGDRFSEDPFILFQLRGRTKEQILAALRQLRHKNSPLAASSDNTETPLASAPQQKRQPTPLKIEQFWEYNEPLDSTLVAIAPAPSNETILNLLGPIPLASDSTGTPGSNAVVMQYLDSIYQSVSQQAVVSALNREE